MSFQNWLDATSCTDSPWNEIVPALRRRRFIETYSFPDALRARFASEYSHFSSGQRELVWRALRQYFTVCALANRQMTAMPSRVTDDAWHLFILFTRDYEEFCRRAFGHYLHHTPAEAMRKPAGISVSGDAPSLALRAGLKTTWRLACRAEGMDPLVSQTLPLLFAVDMMLGVEGATRYDAQQMALFARVGSTTAATGHTSCGGASCSSYSAGSCAEGGSDGGSGCSDSGADGCGDGGGSSGGDGGGCGGGGCGGGCGGS